MRSVGGSALLLAGLIVSGIVAWFAWAAADTREEMNLSKQQAVRVAELRGMFSFLDERLTMSAHMAVVSGEPRWEARYDEASPELVLAIAEAMALATPEVRQALARTTAEARVGLTQMERAALAMARSGDRAGAEALLDGPEFEFLKASYASGIDELGQDLMTFAALRSKALSDRAWFETGGLVLGAVTLAGAVIGARGHLRLRLALAQTAAAARTDDLTGLPNRRHLHEMLGDTLTRVAREGGSVVVLLMDLDRFKAVNDVHGHSAGDELLRLVAGRLRTIARTNDVVARLGGDEFALVAWLRPPWPCPPGDQAAELAQRIVMRLEEPFELREGTVQVGVSIGLVVAEEEAGEVDALMQRADVALYRAKAGGRGRYSFFEPVMEAGVRARAL